MSRNSYSETDRSALGSSRRKAASRARLLGLAAALSLIGAAVFTSCGGGGETGTGTTGPCDMYSGECPTGSAGASPTGGAGGGLFDAGLNGGGGSGQGGMMDACADISVQIEKQIPTVVLLID